MEKDTVSVARIVAKLGHHRFVRSAKVVDCNHDRIVVKCSIIPTDVTNMVNYDGWKLSTSTGLDGDCIVVELF